MLDEFIRRSENAKAFIDSKYHDNSKLARWAVYTLLIPGLLLDQETWDRFDEEQPPATVGANAQYERKEHESFV